MGSTSKHCSNSATTSEDGHHHRPEKFKEDNCGTAGVVVGRFYECNFCKRGFTNAQALGGHMNIHRKGKERGNNNTNNNKVFKLRTPKSSSKSAGDEECTNSSSRYFERYLISSSTTDHDQQQQQYRSVVPINGGKIMNCFQFIDNNNNVPSNSNPNLSTLGYDFDHHHHDYSHISTDSTANLSIQIDHHHHSYNIREDHSDEGRNSTNWKENELDLELRLG